MVRRIGGPLLESAEVRCPGISAFSILPCLKTVAHPDQQAPGRLDLLLRKGSLEKGSNERDVIREDLLKQRMPFCRQSDLGSAPVIGDGFPSNQSLARQSIENSRQCAFRDKGLG